MTDPNKLYNIRDIETGRWLGTRKNGNLFMKDARPNCNAYDGGEPLDIAMGENPGFEAVEVKDKPVIKD